MEAMATQSLNDTTPVKHCSHQRRHTTTGHRLGKGIMLVAIAIAAGFAGGFISKAYAQERGGMMSDRDKAANMDQRATRMAKHLGVEVDATPEQQEKLAAIARSAAKDLGPMREKLRQARQRGAAILGAAKVDRAALEQLRAEQLALMDSNSKRMVQAMADAAEVLTPAQRQKLAEHMKKMGERSGRHGGHGMWGGH